MPHEPVPIRPTGGNYGEWMVYLADIMRRAIVDSERKHLDDLTTEYVHVGRWRKPYRWPWIYISYTRHPIIEANVSGGQLHAEFVYDIVVEHKMEDLDKAEIKALKIVGAILEVLIVDLDMSLTYKTVREARGSTFEILDPLLVVEQGAQDKAIWIQLRTTIVKKLTVT